MSHQPVTMSTPSSEVRKRLGHPVIDVDGHMFEFEPAFLDYVRQAGGPALADRCRAWTEKALFRWYQLSPEERRAQRVTRPPWWGMPTHSTRDFATTMLPKLLHERLPELGVDFAVVYPTMGLFHNKIADEDALPAVIRALNTFYADQFRGLSDRLTPAAIIPMQDPKQAIAELDHAVQVLGFKAIVLSSVTPRPVSGAERLQWLDNYALDSAHDYDPFWARCVELKVAPTAHLAGLWGARTSPSNYVYNHIGMFAAAGEALCKALFLGGVTRRFPTLKFAFLEGGAAWACTLFSDLVEHWKKRNRQAVRQYDPANLDPAQLRELCARYGGSFTEGRLDRVLDLPLLRQGWTQEPEALDEWSRCGIERPEDVRDRFVPSFYFGCEGEDPMNAWAFSSRVNPMGARLKAMFGSDLGHWDVPEPRELLSEAYELVEEGLLTEEDFRDFAFVNPVSLHAGMNPAFFEGTAVESAVAALLASGRV